MLYDIFLSFNSNDLEETKQINKFLSDGEDSLLCWYSEGNIGAGHDHNDIIPEKIRQSGIFVLVLSANSWSSSYVQNEISVAKSAGKFIVPVLIDKNFDVSKVLYKIGDVQYVDISSWSTEALDNLKESLQKELENISDTPWYVNHEEEILRVQNIKDEREREDEKRRILEERRQKLAVSRAKREAEMKVISKDLDKFRKSIANKVYGDINDTTEEAAAKRIKRTAKIILSLIAAIVILVVAFIIVRTNYYTIPLNDYLEVKYSGINGFGTAEVVFNEADFNDKYSKKIKMAMENGVEASGLLSYRTFLSQTDGLSNGNEIELTIESDRNRFKQEYGFDLKFKSNVKVKVSGLLDVEEINPFDNLSVTFLGLNGYGIAEINCTSKDDYMTYGRFNCDNVKNLSNGDTIVVTFTNNRNEDPTDVFIEKYGKAPYPLEMTYEVSGLSMQESYNLFDYITVSFEGMSGQAKIVIEEKEGIEKKLRYKPDKKTDLSNGDEVIITVTDSSGGDPAEYCRSTLGIELAETEKAYTVFGLGEYITSIDQISEESLEKIKNQANDVLASYVIKNWKEDTLPGDTTYEGAYLLNRKEGLGRGDANSIVFVFRTSLENVWDKKNITQPFYYYWYLKYNNVYINPDGEFQIDLMEYKTPNNRISNVIDVDGATKKWDYYGYKTMEELKKDYVERNADNYTYTTSVNEDEIFTKENE